MWNNDRDLEDRVKPLFPNWVILVFVSAIFIAGIVGLIATIISFIGG